VHGQAIPSFCFPPLFGLFLLSPPSSPPFSLRIWHQFVSRPLQSLPSQEEWRIIASQIRKATALAKPASLSVFILLLRTCVKGIHLFSCLLMVGPFGGFVWEQCNPVFMKSMKPGHLNRIECLGPARQPVEEAAASLSPFFLYFGADSRLYFSLKQIKTNRIWWIWKRGKKTLNKQEIYGCCLPMKTQWEESSACNVDGCRLENKA